MTAKLITATEWAEIKRTAHSVDNRKPYFKSATIGDKTHYYELKPSASTQVAKMKRTKFAAARKAKEVKASPSVVLSPLKIEDVSFTPQYMTGEIKATVPVKPATCAQVPTVIEVVQSVINPSKRGVNKNELKIGDKLMNTVTGAKLTIRTQSDISIVKYPLNWKLISTILQTATA
jgi:hypothetical protein